MNKYKLIYSQHRFEVKSSIITIGVDILFFLIALQEIFNVKQVVFKRYFYVSLIRCIQFTEITIELEFYNV